MTETNPPITFGVLVYDDVEVLDLGGPFEVFSTAGRLARTSDGGPATTVITLAPRPGTVTARGGLRLVPDHTVAEDPPFDILVVPGGVTTAVESDHALSAWLRRRHATARLTFGICTGAFLLAQAGLLDGRAATTHWEDEDELAGRWPAVDVRRDVRWVDDGDIVTSAGISAGIDASLYVLGRLTSVDLATRTARQMEYTWLPTPG
ncbi:glutamine amidotransferase [Longispora fulva]|uniref:Transcriptional regulator GlxA family with amidase domain n=1 Tax=Longispora fulva TaxID=619741 RepID=A0A8J7KJP7_9ACTN|nr:DJ-1/PfpI family protein [Longispora fulva]MBG6135681.1 transcriptional regulator GlxA family with amidase domain [Longispora fulva]GIG56080.1 glutamine amidotransferase [Longispora fulva]